MAPARLRLALSVCTILAVRTAWAQAPCEPQKQAALTQRLLAQSPALTAVVARDAVTAYIKATCDGYARRPVLAVVDYSRPSTDRRLWIFDMRRGHLLFHEPVAHGKNSGEIFASRFSNAPSSLMSSLGVFTTRTTYQGKHGLSLYLEGLEPGFNDNAKERAVVIHGAEYLNPKFLRQHRRAGRSWGCPAVPTKQARPIIDALKDGAVLVSWFPDTHWRTSSRFLQRTPSSAGDSTP